MGWFDEMLDDCLSDLGRQWDDAIDDLGRQYDSAIDHIGYECDDCFRILEREYKSMVDHIGSEYKSMVVYAGKEYKSAADKLRKNKDSEGLKKLEREYSLKNIDLKNRRNKQLDITKGRTKEKSAKLYYLRKEKGLKEIRKFNV